MYKYVPNSVVKISVMFPKYFEYYIIILRGPFFVDTMHNKDNVLERQKQM